MITEISYNAVKKIKGIMRKYIRKGNGGDWMEMLLLGNQRRIF